MSLLLGLVSQRTMLGSIALASWPVNPSSGILTQPRRSGYAKWWYEQGAFGREPGYWRHPFGGRCEDPLDRSTR